LERRKKMKKLMVAIGTILLTMAVSTNLLAWEHGRGRAHLMPEAPGHQEGNYALYGKLNLTAEQKARIETLRNAHLRDIKPLQDQMFSKRGDLKLLWLQTDPDKEKILAVQKDIRAIRDQMQDKAVVHRVDVFNILTPEQKEKAKAFFGHGPGPGMWGGKEERSMMGPGAGRMAGPCPGCKSGQSCYQ
jgi:zinc resistance-associated protein